VHLLGVKVRLGRVVEGVDKNNTGRAPAVLGLGDLVADDLVGLRLAELLRDEGDEIVGCHCLSNALSPPNGGGNERELDSS